MQGNPAGNTCLARQEHTGSSNREQGEDAPAQALSQLVQQQEGGKGMLFPNSFLLLPPTSSVVFPLQGRREPVGSASPSPAHPSCQGSGRTKRMLQVCVKFDFQEIQTLSWAQSRNYPAGI